MRERLLQLLVDCLVPCGTIIVAALLGWLVSFGGWLFFAILEQLKCL